MDDELEQPQPKISIVVGVLFLIVCLVMDALGLIPGVDDIEEVPAVILTIASAFFGIGPAMILLEAAVDFLKAIPFIQELPLWTACWIVVWIVENHPSKLTQPLQKALEAAAVAEGDAESLAGESAAVEGEVAAATASAEQSAEITADREALTGEAKTSKDSEWSSGNGSSGQGGGDNEEEDRQTPREDNNDIRLGDEVEPEEQAAAEDFGSKEAAYKAEDDEEPDEKVTDIRTKKPLKRPSNRIDRDEDSQQAA